MNFDNNSGGVARRIGARIGEVLGTIEPCICVDNGCRMAHPGPGEARDLLLDSRHDD